MSLIRSRGFLAIPLVISLIMFADFFLKITPLEAVAGTLRTWALVISSIALGLGVVNLVRVHGKNIYTRKPGMWVFSTVTLFTFVTVTMAGILAKQSGFWNWPFQHVYTTLQQTMYASTGFYIVSSAYRAFRARNVDALLLLISGCVVALRNAPIGEAIWGGFPVLGDWFMDTGQLPAYRVFTMVTSFGLIAYSLRVILGSERGFYGGREQ